MSDTYKKADQRAFDDSGKGMKSKANKSFGIEHGPMGNDEEGGYDPEQDHEAKADADTLHRAHEIKADKDRHEKASYHLEKRMHAAKAAHKDSQKALHGRVKKGLKAAFPEEKGTFEAEKEKETSEAENIVNEKRV